MNAHPPGQSMTATSVKQNFGLALERAAHAPLAIQRHGRTVALMVPPGQAPGDPALERKLARAQQEKVEADRLIRHQRIALCLLLEPAQAPLLVDGARKVVDRWERESQCSKDFIALWRQLLALPIASLAERMCGDLNGWGPALRQNSPWTQP
ncbi:MAG: type II toxin-antitoxin system Phd/YefM family antitoxin [Solimonas sp.]